MSPLTVSVEKVRDVFAAAKLSMIATNTSWKATDARIAVFVKCINVQEVVYAGVTYSFEPGKPVDQAA